MSMSMTGFGEAEEDGYHVEIKGVNYRNKEIYVHLPRELGALEQAIRMRVSSAIHRGKVDVYITRLPDKTRNGSLDINWDMADFYYNVFSKMAKKYGGDVTFRDLVSIPEVIMPFAQDMEAEARLIDVALVNAIDAFLASRKKEWEALKNDMVPRLERLDSLVSSMKDRSGDAVAIMRERLVSNIRSLLSDGNIEVDVDDARVAQEVAILAQKVDITEELVRLESHLATFTGVVDSDAGPKGKKLDFILQEINRELNTIAAKAHVTDLSPIVIEAKTEASKIREQVQNVE